VSREAVADLRSRTAAVLAKQHRGRAGNYSSALPRFFWMGRRLGCRCRPADFIDATPIIIVPSTRLALPMIRHLWSGDVNSF
jgi:hypothetical protein